MNNGETWNYGYMNYCPPLQAIWESAVGVIVVSRGMKYCTSQMSAYLTVSTAMIWKIFLSIRSTGWVKGKWTWLKVLRHILPKRLPQSLHKHELGKPLGCDVKGFKETTLDSTSHDLDVHNELLLEHWNLWYFGRQAYTSLFFSCSTICIILEYHWLMILLTRFTVLFCALTLCFHTLATSHHNNTAAPVDKWVRVWDLSRACLSGLLWLNFVAQRDTVVYKPTVLQWESSKTEKSRVPGWDRELPHAASLPINTLDSRGAFNKVSVGECIICCRTMTVHYNYTSQLFDILPLACLHSYMREVTQSVGLIDIYYVNTMQMQQWMLKVIQYQYAFALNE